MAALYVTSLQTGQAGVGKTAVCAGLAKHLQGAGRKVGFFKPLVADIKDAADSDADFMIKIMVLKETAADLSPVIARDKLASRIKPAYDKVARGKDMVIVEGKPIEAAYEVVKALDARVIIVEPYSAGLSGAELAKNYKDFGDYLLGIVINKVPLRRLEMVSERLSSEGINILGVLPEDRVLSGLTVGELAEHVQGEIVNSAEKSGEIAENFMLGAMIVDAGPDYFNRKDGKAAVVRSDRPDMQLAALETPTKCLVLSGGVPPVHAVLRSARDKEIPIILTKGDTKSIVDSIEQALDKPRFNQEKLPRLVKIMERHFNFQAVSEGLALK